MRLRPSAFLLLLAGLLVTPPLWAGTAGGPEGAPTPGASVPPGSGAVDTPRPTPPATVPAATEEAAAAPLLPGPLAPGTQEIYRCSYRVNESPVNKEMLELPAREIARTARQKMAELEAVGREFWSAETAAQYQFWLQVVTDPDQVRRQFLALRAKDLLLRDMARELSLPISDTWVNERYARAAEQGKTPRDRYGGTLPKFLAQLQIREEGGPQALLYLKGREALEPSPAEIARYYEQHATDFDRPAAVRLRAIVIYSNTVDPATHRLVPRERPEAVAAEVAAAARKNPAEFGALVARHSDEPASRARGGLHLPLKDLRYTSRDWRNRWWVKERLGPLAVACAAPEGEIVGPLAVTSVGAGTAWYILRVEQKAGEGVWPLELVADEIADQLLEQTMVQQQRKFLCELFAKARVEDQATRQLVQLEPPP